MYDVLIIGAGGTGSAIARELSRYNISICVLEKEEDVCCGTTKANSAIIHAGFDATPGSLKALLNVKGNAMMDQLSKDLDIPFHRNGSLVVCTSQQNPSALTDLMEKGIANGVPGLRIVNREELLQMEPNIADDVICALYAPTGAIVCPFHLNMALAENAHENGVEFHFHTQVTNLTPKEHGYQIDTTCGTFDSQIVVNAAGVYGDVFHNMVSKHKLSITARKGEYMLLDKTAGSHVSHTIFQLPSAMGKGVLITPTIHGNLLVGPTATDIEDKEGIHTTREGLESIASVAPLSVKDIPFRQVITSFSGLRAHEAGDDFVIGEALDAPDFYDAVGIESPGLTSAPAIGEYLATMIAKKHHFALRPDFKVTRKGILNPASLSIEERNALIRQNPAYGNIICRCEMISEGEILDAIHRPLGARSLDGLKRRTRAGMGRCQSGFCSPRSMEILARELGISLEQITKNGHSSNYIVGKNKDIEGGCL